MPNLTSYYYAPPVHLNRELPKTYCDLIRHEIDYAHFLRTRIANIQSSLSFTNKKHLISPNKNQRRRYIDHNQRLYHVHQRNLQLCKKILEIWKNNNKQQGGVDCHNENYKKHTNISHFHSRQLQWEDKIENENKRLIRSIIYHRRKYRPTHHRYTAYEAYEHHLKLLQSMSQYPKYHLDNPISKNLLSHQYLPSHIYYKYSQFYNQNPNISPKTQCQTLPFSYKLNKQKPTIKKKLNAPIEYKTIKTKKWQQASTTHVQNVLRQTMDDAIYIYNQPIHIKSLYFENGQRSKPRFYQQQDLFGSASCRQLLEPWRHTKQQRGPLGSYIINDDMIDPKPHSWTQRFFDSYNRRHRQKLYF